MNKAARKLNRREELGVESRRRIIEAASELMAERGFAGTSIAAVSKRSGLPSGSIYWHFDSKAALLSAVVEDGADRWLASLPGPSADLADAEAGISALLQAAADSLEQGPQFLRLMILIALERRDLDEDTLASIRRTRERARERVRGALLTLLEPSLPDHAAEVAEEFAFFALCVADGAFIANHIDPDTTDLRATFGLLRLGLMARVAELASKADPQS